MQDSTYADVGLFAKSTITSQNICDEIMDDSRVEYAELKQQPNFDFTASDMLETSAVRQPGQSQSCYMHADLI